MNAGCEQDRAMEDKLKGPIVRYFVLLQQINTKYHFVPHSQVHVKICQEADYV